LLATTFRRWLCAETALPATLKIWNIDMADYSCADYWV
jgi:hypothetical protein